MAVQVQRSVGNQLWLATIAEMAKSWTETARNEYPRGRDATREAPNQAVTRQWLRKTWRRANHVVVSTMDKSPTDMRLAYPVLSWLRPKGRLIR